MLTETVTVFLERVTDFYLCFRYGPCNSSQQFSFLCCCVSSLCVVCLMQHAALDCSVLIVPSVLSNIVRSPSDQLMVLSWNCYELIISISTIFQLVQMSIFRLIRFAQFYEFLCGVLLTIVCPFVLFYSSDFRIFFNPLESSNFLYL